jgi:hypothetical protein
LRSTCSSTCVEVDLLEQCVEVDVPEHCVEVDLIERLVEVDPFQHCVEVHLIERLVEVDPRQHCVEVDLIDRLVHVNPRQHCVEVHLPQQRVDVYGLNDEVDDPLRDALGQCFGRDGDASAGRTQPVERFHEISMAATLGMLNHPAWSTSRPACRGQHELRPLTCRPRPRSDW